MAAEAVLQSGFAVVSSGTLTTIQDWPGRLGYRSAGVPASGPMDCRSFRLGNLALGNPEGAAGLEITLAGPALRFHRPALIMVTGAHTPVTIDSRPVEQWAPHEVPAGALVEIGTPSLGMRSYLLVRGGITAPEVLGSAATFDLGQLGGLAGRALRPGDVVPLNPDLSSPVDPQPHAVAQNIRTPIGPHWRLAVLEGPHGAPGFFTPEDVEEFYAARWTVRRDADRTGVQLTGPTPAWARRDGGESGLHPSDIQPTPYAPGTVAFAGDQPTVLGPDAPSLGRSTCPATVISADRWKLGQLRPGDTVQFVAVTDLQADDIRRQQLIEVAAGRPAVVDGGVLLRHQATRSRPKVTFRRAGDDHLLIEYGEMTLDISLRMRVHALAEAIAQLISSGELTGIVEITPGVRSLQLQVDPGSVIVADLLGVIRALDEALPSTRDLVVPSRRVRMPVAWRDPQSRPVSAGLGAVADDGPDGPVSLECIRRINGLAEVDDVVRALLEADYLVLGLGESGLGAPVATALDPRHRLVTTRCDAGQISTVAGAVGTGGPFLSVSGAAGPNRSQILGRTVPVWSTAEQSGPYEPGVPWLFRCFDRITWYGVDPEELVEMRSGTGNGTAPVTVTAGTFSMADYDRFLADHLDSIAEFTHRQSSAFADQRLAWQRAGAFRGRPST